MKMKLFIIRFLLFLAFINTAKGLLDIPDLKELVIKELNKMKKKIAIECAIKHPVDNSTIRQVMTHAGVPDHRDTKCWLSCVMTNMGIINNGKIDWKKGTQLNKMILRSKEDKDKMGKVSEICEKEVSMDEKDECQLAYITALCKFKYGKELGLPPGSWEE